MPPLLLEPDRLVIDLHFTAEPRLGQFSGQGWAVNLGDPLRLTFDQKHLRLTAYFATRTKRALDHPHLGVLEARRPLAPMVSRRGKTLIARRMGCGDECFQKVVLPG